MIVRIADEGLLVGVNDCVGIALKVKRGVASIDEDAAEIDELAFDGEDALQYLG